LTFGNITSGTSYQNIGTTTTGSFYSNSDVTSYNSSIETGRVEKGDISNQQFSEIDMEFQKYHISSVMYQLLPESQKPIETKELVKSKIN
jgi:hypothetical protein